MGWTTVLSVMLVASSQSQARVPPTDTEPLAVDWIRLTSGEWLNGELLGFSSSQFEFDSDKTGVSFWDDEDVSDLLLARTALFAFEDRSVFSGKGAFSETEVIITHEDGGETRRPRAELLQVFGTYDSRQTGRWSFDLDFGLNVSRGNSEQSTLSIDSKLKRVSPLTRSQLVYEGRLGTALQQVGETVVDGETVPIAEVRRNTNRHRLVLSTDWFFSRDFFWRVVEASGLYDEFQDIEFQGQPASFIGYRLLKRSSVEASVNLGGAYQYTQFISGADSISTAGPYATAELDWDITGDLELEASARIFADLQLDSSNNNQSSARVKASVDYDITSYIAFNVGATYDYLLEPQGTNPITQQPVVSTDLAVVAGLGIEIN